MKRFGLVVMTVALIPFLASFGTLGAFGDSEDNGLSVPSDRKAPLDQYGAALMQTVREYVERGFMVEARFLIQDLETAQLPQAQHAELADLRSKVDKGFRPDVESSPYNSDTFTVAKDYNGKYGYIDQAGTFVIPSRFAKADEFSEGLALVQEQKEEPQYFIDRTGKKVFDVKPVQELYFYDRDKKTVWMVRDGKDSLEVYDGSFPIPLEKITIEAMGGFHNGLARCDIRTYNIQMKGAYTQGRQGTIYIDKTGRERLFFPSDMFWISKSDHQCRDFSEGRALILRVTSGERLFGYIDTDGKWIQEPAFNYAGFFADGCAAVMYPNTNRWGFLAADGSMAVKPFYKAKSVNSFNDGVLLCTDSVGEKFLAVRKDGGPALEFSYKAADPDNEDHASTIASRSGDGILTLGWVKGTRSMRGDHDDIIESVLGMDRTGKELFAVTSANGKRMTVKEIGDFSNGRCFARCDTQGFGRESWGLLDSRGNWIAAPTKAWIPLSNYRNGLAKIKMTDDGTTAYMDRAGKIVYNE